MIYGIYFLTSLFIQVYLEWDVRARNGRNPGHEIVSAERPNDDGPLEGGGPLDVAAIEVDGDEHERHLTQLGSLVAAVQHLVGHVVNLNLN